MKTYNAMEQSDIFTLSRTELESLVLDLQVQIEELTTPPPNDWHSWFYVLLNIVLHKFPSVDIKREVVLGSQPPRADFVVVNEQETVDLGLRIFRNFRTTNIIEFKNPDDELSESTLWKAIGYVGFYIAMYGISADDRR